MPCSDCIPGTADLDGNASTACENCQLGYYAPSQATACTPCPEGHADLDTDPATPCTTCSSGTYSTAAATVCEPRPDTGSSSIRIAGGISGLS